MSAIVKIILQSRANYYSPIDDHTVRIMTFDNLDEANKFADDFGEKFLFDGTESRYVAEASAVAPSEFVELMFHITIAHGEYILGHSLLSGRDIEANPAMSQALKNPNSAYARSKNGKVIELKDENVGIHTFYTLNSDLIRQLNDAQ